MPVEIVPFVCPHDCPSTCALEVERIDGHTIGRVRGVDPREMAESDLVLMRGRNPFATQINVTTHMSRAREGRPTALIHPVDCAALGLTEGSKVWIGNERGSVMVYARPFDGLQPGVLLFEGIWPNSAFPAAVGINALTSAEPGRPALRHRVPRHRRVAPPGLNTRGCATGRLTSTPGRGKIR